MLDLSFLLDDRCFIRYVLGLEFVDELFLLLELVEHIFRELFCVVLTYAAILGGRQETSEIECLLSDLRNRKISSFKNSLQALKQSF